MKVLRASSQVVYLSYLRIKQAVMSEFFLQNISWPIFCPGDFGPMESVFDGGQSTIFLAEFQKNKEFQRVIIKTFAEDLRGSPLYRSKKAGLLVNYLRIKSSLKNDNTKIIDLAKRDL